MPAIQAISRLPIELTAPADSRSSRADLFQNQFDQKLDLQRSNESKSSPDQSSRIENKKISSKKTDEDSRLMDNAKNLDQTGEAKSDQVKEFSTEEKLTDEKPVEIPTDTVQVDPKQSEKSDETDESAMLNAVLMLVAVVATPVVTDESEMTVATSDQTSIDNIATKPVSAQLVSTTQIDSKKSVEASASTEKVDGQTELPEFQAVEPTKHSESKDLKRESDDSKFVEMNSAKTQAKSEGEITKPVEQSNSNQVDPIRSMIDSTQPKSHETSEVRPAIAHHVARDPEVAQSNVENIVSSIRAQLLPRGGSMQMRLDPPELGALTISLKLVDGRMTASFTTENAEATRMLSNNLGQLKSTLEAGGVQVHRLDVKMSTESFSNTRDDESGRNQQKQSEGSWQQSEQQRREMVNRMWRRYAYGSDELDLVA